MLLERIEQRCLGAIEFVDALSGVRVREPLRLECADLRLHANGSALYVIRGAAGLASHTEAFAEPPDEPPFEDREHHLTVTDPQQRYLPRRVAIKLPRRNAPQSDPDSVLRPIAVALYPGGARAVDPLWALVRASVFVLADGVRVGIANAWLTLQPALAGAGPVHALTDGHGEALLAVAGVAPVRPATGSDEDPDVVFTRDFGATLRVILHRDAVHRADARTPRPIADPDRIEADITLGPPTVRTLNPPLGPLSAGAMRRVEVEVEVTP
jgi:hypothetical protein